MDAHDNGYDWPSALIGGFVTLVVGFITFLAKEIYDKKSKSKDAIKINEDKIIQLNELLRESKAVYNSQTVLRNQLYKSLATKFTDNDESYNVFFSKHYNKFNEDEKDLFNIIRGVTETAMKNVNQRLLDWCNTNFDIEVIKKENPINQEFKKALTDLKDHLTLWFAVYARLEKSPTICLVYLADEQAFGTIFPQHIEPLTQKLVDAIKHKNVTLV